MTEMERSYEPRKSGRGDYRRSGRPGPRRDEGSGGAENTANVLRVRAVDTRHERDRARTAKNASWTTPEEIAATIMHLCSDEAGVINGARIPLYGSP